jgi:hypothetical protein
MIFIKEHLLSVIDDRIEDIFYQTKHNGFIYFDEPVIDEKYTIDRVSRLSPFKFDEILPVDWYKLKGSTLLKIFEKIKKQELYISKNINGVNYKFKIDEIP